MKLREFLRDHSLSLVLNIFGCLILGSFLRFIEVSFDHLFLIFSVWGLLLLYFYGNGYLKQRRRIKNLSTILSALDQKNLFAEIAPKPKSAIESYYFDFMKEANRSMTKQISDYRRDFEEYQEYIEQWVHDVKTPIVASQLIIENSSLPPERNHELLNELNQIDYYVEQALFYARSEQTNKDYLIQEVALTEVIHEVIQKNQRALISSGFQVDVNVEEQRIGLDKKWVIFIITQIIKNSIQYKQTAPKLSIYAEKAENTIDLTVRDNGIGIPKEELSRVFDKGFTGKKGRDYDKSSGIGLYLCKRLCDKLGIGIEVQSVLGEYTAVTLHLPQQKQF